MGEITTLKIMTQLVKEWTQPDEMKVSWNINNSKEIDYAKKKFLEYLADGWMAFSDEPRERRQIFEFNSKLKRIVLIPPLGGG
jgi:hypothetical protein